ncbi:TetR/AcrR family transcriptional regulator [Methanobrevibacter arboriphilus]|uniref:TetR/AcrR family transcriptional regulator n=1 Tax=Methanobrevibacter arboriphilus TaxID=39441 RepID=UPI0009EAE382|nr:TetR/AcrR family transcriptional regulator [Methanobrevibacter arboriphilus]
MEKITTKEKIFNVAIDLFSKKGYNQVSMREIATEVGIKEASIYYHYSKKKIF